MLCAKSTVKILTQTTMNRIFISVMSSRTSKVTSYRLVLCSEGVTNMAIGQYPILLPITLSRCSLVIRKMGEKNVPLNFRRNVSFNLQGGTVPIENSAVGL